MDRDPGTGGVPDWPSDPFGHPDEGGLAEPQWPGTPVVLGGAVDGADETVAGGRSRTAWPVDPFAREAAAGPRGQEWHRGSGSRRQRRSEGPTDLGFLARGSMLNLVGVIANTLFSFLLVIVVTHKLPPETAGVFFVAIALFTIISNTAELGADGGFLRMIPRYRALGRTQDLRRTIRIGLWPCLLAGIAGGALMYVFAPQLVHLFFTTKHRAAQGDAVPFIRALAPFLPLSAASTVILAGTRGFGAMVPAVVIENVSKPIVRPILILVAVTGGLGGTAVALLWAGPIAVGFVGAAVWLYLLLGRAERRDRYSGRPRSRRELMPEFWRFAGPRGLAGAVNTSQTWLSTLLVGGLATTGEAAVFTASSRFISLGAFAIQAMQLVVAPQVAGLLAIKDRTRTRTVYQTATQWLMAPSWPIYFMLAVFAPLFLRVYPPRFEAGQDTLLILALALLLTMSTGPVSILLVMGGKSGWTLINSVVALGVAVGLNLWLVPLYGINGAAIAWAISMAYSQIAMLIQVRVFLGLSPWGPGAAIVAVGSAAIYGGLGLLTRVALGVSIPDFVAYFVVATVLYTLFLWRFRRTLQLGELMKAVKGRRGGRGRSDVLPDAAAAE